MKIDKFAGEYRWLSNFFPAPIQYGGAEYPSSEHLYQAMKTLDPQEREWVRISPTAGVAKKRGQKVTVRDNWSEIKYEIMTSILAIKFEQNPELRGKLLATGDAELIEGNFWNDVEWGVCNGIGQNKLGLALQALRKEIRKCLNAQPEKT